MLHIDKKQIDFFQEHGYLIIEKFMDLYLVEQVAHCFPLIFNGFFETTIPPDEWRWAEGRDPDNVTRMIWNAWKSNTTIASLALHEKIGYFCAQLAGWSGTRLNQDGCLWKPPGANGLEFHQDIQYTQWIVPNEMITCWVALDHTSKNSGTLEYAKGSHKWPLIEHKAESFHDPDDHQSSIKNMAVQLGKSLEIISVEVPAGGAAFHHSRLWHGSGKNTTATDRRAIALHCMPDIAQFHPTHHAFAQGRFRKFNDTTMEESFYPVLWSEEGKRSGFIEPYIESMSVRPDYKSHFFKK
jgi:phytanoyl-CoA hydroxylase